MTTPLVVSLFALRKASDNMVHMDIAEQRMQQMLANAQQRVAQILGTAKAPKLASQVDFQGYKT